MPQIASQNFRHILVRNLALPLLLGIASAAAFIGLIAYLMHAVRWVEHTDQVLTRAYALQTAGLEMESSARGFLLSGDERLLQVYQQAGNQDVMRDDLRSLLQDNPVQVARLDRIQGLQRQWNSLAGAMVDARGREPAYKPPQDEVTEALRMRLAIRDEFNDFVGIERRVRVERLEAANRNAIESTVAFVLLMLVVGGVLAWRGRADLLGLSVVFEQALGEQRRQSEELQAQAWTREGQALLSDRLAGEQGTGDVGRAALDSLAGYLDARVGALYVPAGDGGALQRVATYGWAQDAPAVGETIDAGRTLLAEAAARKRQITLPDVPAGYLRVASSLATGDAASVLIAPLVHEGTLCGVVELGFMRPLKPSDGELLEAVSTLVGASLRGAHFRQRLQDMLEETQQLNEELQVQQEELRTANEELEQQTSALEESQVNLENQQAELEQTNQQLAEQAQTLADQRDALRSAQGELEERADELQRSSQYKSEFLANMSHELRTPLNSSLILARLLADNAGGNLNAEQIKFAESIYSAGNDLLNLINDILDIAKVEAGKLEMRPEVTPMAAVVQTLRSLFEPLAGEKGLALVFEVAPDAPADLFTDRQRVEQVLRNLLSNGIKFTERGTVSLRVAADGPGRVRFDVRDSGIGIDASQHGLIFEPFHQADGTTSRRFGGTGLGLSISRDLARLLGGDLRVQSAPGQGSTFTLSLPARYDDHAATPRPSAAPLALPYTPHPPVSTSVSMQLPRVAPTPIGPAFPDDRGAPPDGRRTVLVVEDDRVFARILFDLAHELGFRCVVAHQAEEGVELAIEHRPHAVLLDMRLPDGTGLMVLQRLKDNPETRHLPVHILSVEDQAETALQLGAVGYATKPATREQLRGVFQRLEDKLSQKVKRVLVVEDDARQRESVSRLIGDQDVEITAVGSGGEALEALAGGVFDCMVIDLSLPDMTGQELLRRMASGESRSFPPVVVYTGRNLSRDEEAELLRYSRSIIIKGARSPERLLDEVTLFLHRVEADLSAERQKMLRTARSREKAFESRRIMVVDDDVRNIFALTSALEHKGAEVVVARNGVEALDKLGTDDAVDLVLMDLMMPEMDGYTAMREIRRNPAWQKLPIIAVTAKAMKDDQERCLAAGANDYLAKPIELERLFSLMRVWMPKLERL